MNCIITITEVNPVNASDDTEYYRRRVELPDVQTTIRAIDTALNVKPRKPRSDRGTSRKAE